MKKSILMSLAVILCLSVFMAFYVSADVGNVYEDDWGYEGDWGDGYDYGNSDFDLFDTFYFFSPGIVTGNVFVTFICIFVIAFAVVVILSKFTHGKNSGSSHKQWRERRGVESFTASVSEEQIVNEIKVYDPAFSAEDMRSYVKDVFIKVQEAWERRDYEVVRPYESEKLFSRHESQIREYIDRKQTNHLDSQNILSAVIVQRSEDGFNERLTVRLTASLLDYTTDDISGALIRGSTTQRTVRAYRLEFIRKKGVLTSVGHSISSKECPSCGAPVAINNTGRCEYCKNIITDGSYSWILNEYTAW